MNHQNEIIINLLKEVNEMLKSTGKTAIALAIVKLIEYNEEDEYKQFLREKEKIIAGLQ
jgi:hypothetical protein